MGKNLPMTVMKAGNGEGQYVVIELGDVDFVETRDRRIVYHIGDQEYYQINNKGELENLLIENGFDPLDRPFLVNMGKIRLYDKEFGRVYFVDKPDKKSKFVTVSRMKMGLVEGFIDYFVHKNQDTQNEISFKKSPSIMKWINSLSKGRL